MFTPLAWEAARIMLMSRPRLIGVPSTMVSIPAALAFFSWVTAISSRRWSLQN